jgi:hypothetical protein
MVRVIAPDDHVSGKFAHEGVALCTRWSPEMQKSQRNANPRKIPEILRRVDVPGTADMNCRLFKNINLKISREVLILMMTRN